MMVSPTLYFIVFCSAIRIASSLDGASCPVYEFLDAESGKCVKKDICDYESNECSSGQLCYVGQDGHECVDPSDYSGELLPPSSGLEEVDDEIKVTEKPSDSSTLEPTHEPTGHFDDMLDHYCEMGYRYSAHTQQCEDVDECQEAIFVCFQEYRCVNTQGSYTCEEVHCDEGQVSIDGQCETMSCDPGFTFDPVYHECVDIDECLNDPCTETEVCQNGEGSFSCHERECPAGFRPNESYEDDCQDIDECLESDGQLCGPNANCSNNVGSYVCNCNPGYEMDSGQCLDIDECQNDDEHYCFEGEYCFNTEGSYDCMKIDCDIGYYHNETGSCIPVACEAGFRYDATWEMCKDIDECKELRPCKSNELCTNTEPGYACAVAFCAQGYRPSNYIGGACVDINECEENADQNLCSDDHLCINTDGGYHCDCPAGFKDVDGACQDIDECEQETELCISATSTCNNTIGSFRCICKQGFQGHRHMPNYCVDINECLDGATCPSDAQCVNLKGSSYCRCPYGTELSDDGKTCDIFKCHGIEVIDKVLNINHCKCPQGFRLDTSGRYCRDVNECDLGPNCDQDKQACVNTYGSFKCVNVSCTEEYRKDGSTCRIKDKDSSKANMISHQWVTLRSNVSRISATNPIRIYTIENLRKLNSNMRYEFKLQLLNQPLAETIVSRHFKMEEAISQDEKTEVSLYLISPLMGPRDLEFYLDVNLLIERDGATRAIAAHRSIIHIFVSQYDGKKFN
ncbi:Latent-transforming growth factor beta-binding protein 4 [Halotydeus destructor]|nr:Latent-transforming growth factor beta-binding protein 4 [Halotydeus destructor]